MTDVAQPSGDAIMEVRDLVKHFPIRAGFLQRQVGAVQAVDGDPAHEVACLLPVQTRRELWRHLAAGEPPDRARAVVPMGDAR